MTIYRIPGRDLERVRVDEYGGAVHERLVFGDTWDVVTAVSSVAGIDRDPLDDLCSYLRLPREALQEEQ